MKPKEVMDEEIVDRTEVVSDQDIYGYRRDLTETFETTLSRVRETLMAEGFGVLTEINMKEKLKEKIDVDFREYVILGACNPPLAYSALSEDLDIGLLLPCNVIVYENDQGSTVAAIDAEKMLAATENPNMLPMAQSVNEKLQRAIDAV